MLFGLESGGRPNADELPCCAAKATILSRLKGLSKTWAMHGILAKAVSPELVAPG